MTRGAPPLTIVQKDIIMAHPELFVDDLMKLSGMEGTSKRQILDFRRRIGKTDEERVIEELEEYIGTHGLPEDQAHGVMKYIRYLKQRM